MQKNKPAEVQIQYFGLTISLWMLVGLAACSFAYAVDEKGLRELPEKSDSPPPYDDCAGPGCVGAAGQAQARPLTQAQLISQTTQESILGTENFGNFELIEDLPEQISPHDRESVLSSTRELLIQSFSQYGTLSDFHSFTVNGYSTPSADQQTYRIAIAEIAQLLTRASHSLIDILTLNQRRETLTALVQGEKLQKQIESEYFSLVGPLYHDFVSHFVFSNPKLTELLQACETPECAHAISEAQMQLIQLGRFINKEKHPYHFAVHPLISRAIEELKFKSLAEEAQESMIPANPTQAVDGGRSKYLQLFSTVLDIFNSDLQYNFEHPHAREMNLRTALNLGSPFRRDRKQIVPHVSETLIKAEIKYIQEIESNVFSHISLGTPLKEVTKKPRYHHYKLKCTFDANTNIEAHGHLLLLGSMTYSCTSLKDQSQSKLKIITAGPGLGLTMNASGYITIDSPVSTATPYGTWLGTSFDLTVMAGGRVFSAIGEGGSFLNGGILEAGFNVISGISVIQLQKM